MLEARQETRGRFSANARLSSNLNTRRREVDLVCQEARLVIEIDGPEPPILDGDALSFVRLIDKAGINEVEGPRDMIRILRKVEVGSGDARATLLPAAQAEFFFEIEFASAAIL